MVGPKADVWPGWPNAETCCVEAPKANVPCDPWLNAEVPLAEPPNPVWPKADCPNPGLPNAVVVVVVPPNADGTELVPKAGVVNPGTVGLKADADASA